MPVVDVVRLVNENTALEMMDITGTSEPCFFVLQRDPQMA